MTYSGQFTVAVGATSTTLSPVTGDVINVSLSVGRQRITDRWTPDICTVELYAPATGGYTVPDLGGWLRLNDANKIFIGIITDVRRDYGMPYNSGTGDAPADRITITAASVGKYYAGRGYATSVSIPTSQALSDAIASVWFDGVSSIISSPSLTGNGWSFIAQNETYTGNVLDYLNTSAQSVAGYITDRGASGSPNMVSNGTRAVQNHMNFSDVPGSQSSVTWTYYYDSIEFLASDDNSYTQINVAYNSGAGTATALSGGQPYNAYNTTSNLENLADAQQVADVDLAILSQSAYRPFRVSTRSALWQGVLGPYYVLDQFDVIGTTMNVTFRGTTYALICEGFTVSQDLEDARWTFYFSPSLGVPLILDSTAFGILDTNTLGIG